MSLMVMLVVVGQPAAKGVPLANPAGDRHIWADEMHPRPQWVKDIEAEFENRQKQKALVKALPLSRQIEFAAFQTVDWEPPDFEWAVWIGHESGARVVPVLKVLLAKEPSDRFAAVLVEIAALMVCERGAHIDDTDRRTLYEAAKRRVSKIRNPARRDRLKLDLEQLQTGRSE